MQSQECVQHVWQGAPTAGCSKTDQDKFKCTSCKVTGHAPCDRLCPKFMEVCRRMQHADPEHTYKYFLGQEAWTWEQEPSDEPPNAGSWHGSGILWPQGEDEWDKCKNQAGVD